MRGGAVITEKWVDCWKIGGNKKIITFRIIERTRAAQKAKGFVIDALCRDGGNRPSILLTIDLDDDRACIYKKSIRERTCALSSSQNFHQRQNDDIRDNLE